MKQSTKLLLAFTAISFFAFSGNAQFSAWSDATWPDGIQPEIQPARYRSLHVDVLALGNWLQEVPGHGHAASASEAILNFPLPQGTRSYRVVEERVMAEGLQQRYPMIRTFTGVAADGLGGTVHFDLTPRGFHAMLLTPGEETVYIDPADRAGSSGWYLAYTRSAFFETTDKRRESCEVHENPAIGASSTMLRMGLDVRHSAAPKPEAKQLVPPTSAVPNGTHLRTYRLALACTGEYAQYHGGTVTGALSAMATSMVRINGVYHRDVAIHMEMVANNDAIVYLNGSTDPYSNNDGGAMLGENQTTCDANIGFANYDIGHVFSTGGGGVAYLQSPCSSIKAGGVTGGGNPVGDPFDIDYVCHEMGHQFGGNHTQNNSCNRASSAAYEPGSASTIMGYAGICSPNLQSNSDDHFHVHSINEIIAFSVNGNGNNCAVSTASGNTPPTVEAGASGKTIPKSTAFELEAVADDVDAAAELSYNWEQYDLGPATASGDNNLTNPSGNQPIFRSWPSSTSPIRVFPRIPDLVSGTTTIGEHLPTYSRNLKFKCSVRDNQTTGGFADDLVTLSVDGNSGPFVLNLPNGGNTIEAGLLTTVSWNVANTNVAPVSCTAVDIWLSVDGGFNWDYLVATDEANDGEASIILPNVPTSSARLKVKAANNYFFDISNANFTITPATDPVAIDAWLSGVSGGSGEVCGDSLNPIATVTNLGTTPLTALDVTFSLDGGASELTVAWTGSLAYLESVDIDACSGSLCLAASAGGHVLDVSVSLPGLTDENTNNNNASSAFESGCFEGCSICGCTDDTACNYAANAVYDDGSCTYAAPGLACDCFEELSVSESLSANETAVFTIALGGDLEGVDAVIDFIATSNSWPGDLLLGICDPSGNCVEVGGYGAATLGYTDQGGWPGNWNTPTTGTYTAALDATAWGLSGVGDWTFTIMNGYAASGPVSYNIDFTFQGVCAVEVVAGCNDASACNYDPTANSDDGSCTYPELYLDCAGDCVNDGDGDGVCDENEILGCTDLEACNYNPEATDSGDCLYPAAGYDCDGNPLSTCPEDLNGNGLVEIQDMLLLLSDFGCLIAPCVADLNDDGQTTIADMLSLLSAFGTDCW